MATTGATAAQTIGVTGQGAIGIAPTTALMAAGLAALAVVASGTVTALMVNLGDAWTGMNAARVV